MSDIFAVVGEALIDRVLNRASGDDTSVPGGSPLNVAVGLGWLGHSVHFASQVGVDDEGGLIRHHLEDSGVTLVNASAGPTKTSSATATVSADGTVDYLFDVSWEGVGDLWEQPYRHLHAGSIAVTLEPGASIVRSQVERQRDRGATISYDPNVRPGLMGNPEGVLTTVENMVGSSHLVKASAEDIAWLYPGWSVNSVCDHWRSLGALVVLLTNGPEPVLLDWLGQRREFIVPRVTVVDTIGAGDACMSGLLHGFASKTLLGADNLDRWRDVSEPERVEIMESALQCAAFSVARVGAAPPRLSEVNIS